MTSHKTILSDQDKQWILERRFTRLTDNKEVQIYPMGAERYLSFVLNNAPKKRYKIRADVVGKNILVIPGYANSSILFALAGAKSVTAYDKDPVTVAWMKAFKKYYHYCEYDAHGKPYPSVGELIELLTAWYPPLVSLPKGKIGNFCYWLILPNSLRRIYVHYMISLAVRAVQENQADGFELQKNIVFHTGTAENLEQYYDTAFVPYLLGVRNGIEEEAEIVTFMEQLFKVVPEGRIIVSPSRAIREFHLAGKRYLDTIAYNNLQEIPDLKTWLVDEDPHWFKNQGIVVFQRNLVS